MNVGLPSETIKNAAIRIKELEHENERLQKQLKEYDYTIGYLTENSGCDYTIRVLQVLYKTKSFDKALSLKFKD